MIGHSEPSDRLIDIIRGHAAANPSDEALIFGSERITYDDLVGKTEQCAKALIVHGVQPGDRVACYAPPHPLAIITALAAFAIGAVWVGLNPKYKRGELQRLIQDCQPSVIMAASADGLAEDALQVLSAALEGATATLVSSSQDPDLPWVNVDAFLQQGDRLDADCLAERIPADEDERLAAIVYTSGSTGHPKGAMLSEQRMVRFARTQNEVWPVKTFRSLNYFPINHVGSLIDVTLPTLVAGGTMVILDEFDPQEALRLMEDEKVTVWGSVPAGFLLQLGQPNFGKFDLSSVELIVWEGAPLAKDAIAALSSIHPRLATNYSMTETTGAVTVVKPTNDVDVLSQSVGFPLKGIDVKLITEDGALAGPGETGEIFVRSPYAMLGYWQRSDETAQTIDDDGFIKTGDLGVWHADGSLGLVGRNKEMYKSGGYNVYPREIETLLESHPAVASAYIVSIPDRTWDEVGFAFIVPQSDVSAADLTAFLKDHAANFKAPKHFCITADLPLLPIGKVDKRALKDRALTLSGQS
ncbi:MAG: class I adenylate-forming enzyme family protein [Pseudomonadota bacterium]